MYVNLRTKIQHRLNLAININLYQFSFYCIGNANCRFRRFLSSILIFNIINFLMIIYADCLFWNCTFSPYKDSSLKTSSSLFFLFYFPFLIIDATLVLHLELPKESTERHKYTETRRTWCECISILYLETFRRFRGFASIILFILVMWRQVRKTNILKPCVNKKPLT